jgi:hypothetical protein
MALFDQLTGNVLGVAGHDHGRWQAATLDTQL